MSGPELRTVLAPVDGSLGPLLRVSDDRLGPGQSYGVHEHRSVDVVAVLLTGSLRHRWREGAALHVGDMAVLRAGQGLVHDEVAGDEGARVLQCYLRPADPVAPPEHEVHRGASGWVGLRRPDARIWISRAVPGVAVTPPEGLLLTAGDGTSVTRHDGGPIVPSAPATLLLWRLDTGRPPWADD